MLNRIYVVISAELSTLNAADNDGRSDDLLRRLNGRFDSSCVDEVQGCYKGTLERSFVVQCKDHSDVGVVHRFAKEFSQESILLVDSRRTAFLLYVDSLTMERLGHLYTQYDQPTTDAWTYNADSGTYFYVV
ncbi:hypothetical protein Atoyac14_23 [Aeromonas phage Atoyac14]|uniref:Uncharacterized protein n=1 Tax=Aeromonas phage Atoyac1 TaxID=2767547 RepID=A0A866D1Q3_9CAUD|nr:hypothetical protein Atoyac1_23 [Aeromonas phage Atoyac1]QOC54341.1 hypothetical protein Atoyac14_23 [Aeromonas phage Atoyac14]